MDNPRFKIDVGGPVWNYAVYERKKFLGISYWDKVKNTDHFEVATNYVEMRKRLPIYYA